VSSIDTNISLYYYITCNAFGRHFCPKGLTYIYICIFTYIYLYFGLVVNQLCVYIYIHILHLLKRPRRAYLPPLPGVPQGRAVEAVAGLHGGGLGGRALLVPHGPGVVAAARRPLGAGHGSRHQAHAARGRAHAPLAHLPPAGEGGWWTFLKDSCYTTRCKRD